MASNIILFTFTANALKIYPFILTKKRDNTWHDTWEILAPKPLRFFWFAYKCKINHICGHSTRYLSYKWVLCFVSKMALQAIWSLRWRYATHRAVKILIRCRLMRHLIWFLHCLPISHKKGTRLYMG